MRFDESEGCQLGGLFIFYHSVESISQNVFRLLGYLGVILYSSLAAAKSAAGRENSLNLLVITHLCVIALVYPL